MTVALPSLRASFARFATVVTGGPLAARCGNAHHAGRLASRKLFRLSERNMNQGRQFVMNEKRLRCPSCGRECAARDLLRLPWKGGSHVQGQARLERSCPSCGHTAQLGAFKTKQNG